MKLNSLPPFIGWQWIQNAFAVFKQRPFFFCAIQLLGFLFILAGAIVPYIGSVIAHIVSIYFGLIFVLFAHAYTNKLFLSLGELLNSVYQNKQVFLLSITYTAAALIIWLITDFIHSALAPQLITQMQNVFQAIESGSSSNITFTVADQDIFINYTILMQASNLLINLLLFMFFSTAPVLCYWHKLSTGKAIFCNFMAFKKNLAAFILYFIIYGAISLAIFFIAGFISFVLMTAMGQASIAILLPLLLIAALGCFCIHQLAVYFMYKDCFLFD